jgi:adenylyltransferase/sulfurtransferase
MEGQVAVFDYRDINSPCYQCLYQEVDNDVSCSTNGVMAPVVGIIGSMQAMETIKLISEIGRPLVGRVLLLDASAAQWREVRLLKDPDCKACGGL